MTQDEINDAEWRNPENWSDRFVGIYFSKKDTRTWVPKRSPRLGWTLNLAHPRGAYWLIGLFVGTLLLVLAAAILSHFLQ